MKHKYQTYLNIKVQDVVIYITRLKQLNQQYTPQNLLLVVSKQKKALGISSKVKKTFI